MLYKARVKPQIVDYQQRVPRPYRTKGRVSSKPPKDQNATIHNNNIIITINKSFNLAGDAAYGKAANNHKLTSMENIYSSKKPRRNAKNAMPPRPTPLKIYTGNDRGRSALKYMTQRIKTAGEKPDLMTGTGKMEVNDEDFFRKIEASAGYDSGNYSDLEVIREGGREKARGSVNGDKRGRVGRMIRRGGFAQFKKFMPALQRGAPEVYSKYY